MASAIREHLRLIGAGGSSKKIDLREYEADLPEIDEVVSIAGAALVEKAWNVLQQDGSSYGDELPWPKARHAVRLRPQELSCWIGPNGDGKSMALNHAMAHLAWKGARVAISSLEMPAEMQIARMVTQLTCEQKPDRARFMACVEQLDESVTFWNHVGPVSPRRMLALVRYFAIEVKAAHIVVDNLTVICPPGRNNEEEATRFVGGLLTTVRDHGCHVHLVCHVRKPTDFRFLNRHDLRGTGAVADVVDNVFIVQRNDQKARAAEGSPEAAHSNPDVFFIPDKERSHLASGDRRPVGFWWHGPSYRLTGYLEAPEAYL